jgi:hypothetical protein
MPVCETGVGVSFGVGVGIGADRAGRARLVAMRSGRCMVAVWWFSPGERREWVDNCVGKGFRGSVGKAKYLTDVLVGEILADPCGMRCGLL